MWYEKGPIPIQICVKTNHTEKSIGKKTRPYICLGGALGLFGGRRAALWESEGPLLGPLGGSQWPLAAPWGVFRLLLGRSSGALWTHLGSFFASPGCSSAALLALSGRSLRALWALWMASWEPPWFSFRALRMLCWLCQGQQQASEMKIESDIGFVVH